VTGANTSIIVSVVLAVHNGAATLDAAIASVRAQTLRDLELVIVDDGSTDETAAVIARHAREDDRIVILRNHMRRGLAAALNLGWRRARDQVGARIPPSTSWAPARC
jgi:glycosyltransferase involved in cell wall biosynthesis